MARTRRGEVGPHPPDPAPTPAPAPARPASGDVWDGVEAGPDVEVSMYVDDVVLQESRWTGAQLAGRRFGGLRVRDVEFARCDLSGAVLEDAVLTRVRFVGCRLTGVVLSGATPTDVAVTDCSAGRARARHARVSSEPSSTSRVGARCAPDPDRFPV